LFVEPPHDGDACRSTGPRRGLADGERKSALEQGHPCEIRWQPDRHPLAGVDSLSDICFIGVLDRFLLAGTELRIPRESRQAIDAMQTGGEFLNFWLGVGGLHLA
jgi:hypothetical protein